MAFIEFVGDNGERGYGSIEENDCSHPMFLSKVNGEREGFPYFVLTKASHASFPRGGRVGIESKSYAVFALMAHFLSRIYVYMCDSCGLEGCFFADWWC